METKIENPVGSVSKYSKLIALIQNHVLTRRIRISESFKDFDKLRSYSIRKEDFLRGLTYMGLTFTEDEQDCLAIAYSDPKKQGNCRWKDFDRDIEKGTRYLTQPLENLILNGLQLLYISLKSMFHHFLLKMLT